MLENPIFYMAIFNKNLFRCILYSADMVVCVCVWPSTILYAIEIMRVGEREKTERSTALLRRYRTKTVQMVWSFTVIDSGSWVCMVFADFFIGRFLCWPNNNFVFVLLAHAYFQEPVQQCRSNRIFMLLWLPSNAPSIVFFSLYANSVSLLFFLLQHKRFSFHVQTAHSSSPLTSHSGQIFFFSLLSTNFLLYFFFCSQQVNK